MACGQWSNRSDRSMPTGPLRRWWGIEVCEMQVLNGATSYPATLLSVDTGCAFDEFEQKLHHMVPEAPMFLLSALIAQCAQWDEIIRATTDHAPYGFVRYWTSPGSRLMHAAGHHGCVSSYLIGNYELAEEMYGH